MNKKAFIGVTAITATVVGGLVYFRHRVLVQLDKWLQHGEEPETTGEKWLIDKFPEDQGGRDE